MKDNWEREKHKYLSDEDFANLPPETDEEKVTWYGSDYEKEKLINHDYFPVPSSETEDLENPPDYSYGPINDF